MSDIIDVSVTARLTRAKWSARAADAGACLADDPYLPATAEFAQWMEG
jgi:hypothetical protein